MPDEEAEERIVVSVPDFDALKESIAAMRHPAVTWSSWATTFIGIGVGTLIAWLVMPSHGTTQANTVLIAAVGAFVLATFMGWVGKDQRARDRSDKTRIIRTMERLEKTCPRFRAQPDSTTESGAL